SAQFIAVSHELDYNLETNTGRKEDLHNLLTWYVHHIQNIHGVIDNNLCLIYKEEYSSTFHMFLVVAWMLIKYELPYLNIVGGLGFRGAGHIYKPMRNPVPWGEYLA
ncbi:hypothetical protein ACJX0J_023404, partial [Zea mays]